MPRKAGVPDEILLKYAKYVHIFDGDKDIKGKPKVKPESAAVWEDLYQCLINDEFDIKKHNIYTRFQLNRNNISTLLKKLQEESIDGNNSNLVDDELPPIESSDALTVINQGINKETNSNDNGNARRKIADILHEMKFSVKYKATIQRISLINFEVIYWNPIQIHLWKKLVLKEGYPVTLSRVYNLIDNIQINNYEPEDLIFFSLITHSSMPNSIPMIQAIAENKNIELFITGLFLELLKCTEQPPVFITEFSYELLNGSSTAFNNCSIYEYVSQCIEYLCKPCIAISQPPEKVINLPETLIFVELYSVLQYINNLEIFKTQDESVQNLLIYSIIYLSSSVDAMEASLVIANNEEEDSIMKNFRRTVIESFKVFSRPYYDSSTEIAVDILKKKVRNQETKNLKNSYENYKSNLIDCNMTQNKVFKLQDKLKIANDEISCYIKAFFNSQIQLANEEYVLEAGERNPYYDSGFFELYLEILYLFPIWTYILVGNKKVVPTCLHNERNFIKKHYSSNGKMSFENFLVKNIDFTEDLSQVFFEKLENMGLSKDDEPECTGLHYCLTFEEDWMGKNENLRLKNKDQKEFLKEHEEFNSCTDDEGQSEGFNESGETSNDEDFRSNKPSSINESNNLSPIMKVNPKRRRVQSAEEQYNKMLKSNLTEITVTKRNEKKPCEKRRIAKYTEPPQYDLDLWYEQQSKKKGFKPMYLTNGRSKIEILKGNLKGNQTAKYTLGDTSAFDSIFEIFCFGFLSLKDFQTFVETMDCTEQLCIFRFIKDWCTTGKRGVMNKNRGEVILKYGSRSRQNIKITDKLETFYSRILEDHCLIKISCEKCEVNYTKDLSIIKLMQKELVLEKKNFENEILKKFSKSSLTTCHICHSSMVEAHIPVIFIDIEECGIEVFLNVFLDEIKISDIIKYIQVGVIGYEMQGNDKKYVAYTKSIRNSWHRIDSSKNPVNLYLKKLPLILPAAIIYIRIETTQ